MKRNRIFTLSFILLVVASGILVRPINAQSFGALVAVYETFPGSPFPTAVSLHAPGSVASTFTDNWARYVTPNGRYAMAYIQDDRAGAGYTVTDLQARHDIASGGFTTGHDTATSVVVSPDGEYFAIVLVDNTGPDGNWSLTIFRRTDFTVYSFSDHVDASTGRDMSPYLPLIPSLEGWTGDDAALIVSTRIPNSDAPFRNYFKIAMSDVPLRVNGSGPVPATTALAPDLQISRLAFSPDSMRAVVGYADPSNLPRDYVPATAGPGSSLPINTLFLLDLTSGTTQQIATAGPGQGLSGPAWSSDEANVYFAGGDFHHSPYVTDPWLYTYNLAARAVTASGELIADHSFQGVTDLSICNGVVFSRQVSSVSASGVEAASIFSAPLSSLLTQRLVFGTQENALGPCISTYITPVLLPTYAPTIVRPAPAAASCVLTPHLVVGGQGIVTPGSANNVRAAASSTAALIGQIPANGVFTVLDGPSCDPTGNVYWKVSYNGLVGFTSEGKGNVYYVVPYVASAQPPLPGPTVTPIPPVNVPAPTLPAPISATQTQPVTLDIKTEALPAVYKGACPTTITFKAEVFTSAPVTITYRWERNDGGSGPVQSLSFAAAGSQIVTDSWTLGGAGMTYQGWEALHILTPVDMASQKTAFDLNCTN